MRARGTKKPGRTGPGSLPRPRDQPADGRFIWQLVGVLAM